MKLNSVTRLRIMGKLQMQMQMQMQVLPLVRSFGSSSTSKGDKEMNSLLKDAWSVELKSGLRYRDVNANNGTSTTTTSDTAVEKEVASDGDKVSIHYTGYLPSFSMKIFDSSLPRGKPISFTLGDKQVIAGWEEGILGMKEGSRRHLLIPPHLGYGYNEVGAIPSGSTLLFDCELLKIEKKKSFSEKIKSFIFNNIFKYG